MAEYRLQVPEEGNGGQAHWVVSENTHDLTAEIREASQRISAGVAAAIDLYVLERGPLRIEHDEQGAKFVVTQAVRLRLKEAEEIRADERERAAERVAVLERESEVQLWSDIIAAARGGES